MSRSPSAIRLIPIAEFQAVVSQSFSYAEIIRKLNLSKRSGSHIATIKRLCHERGIGLTHLKNRAELTKEHSAGLGQQMVEDWLSNRKGFVPTTKGWQHELRNPLRDWVFKRAGYKCEQCGWAEKHSETQIVPVQIHHRDGDATNNRPENLQVLCPNCHSLTHNFGRRNRDGKRCKRYADKS